MDAQRVQGSNEISAEIEMVGAGNSFTARRRERARVGGKQTIPHAWVRRQSIRVVGNYRSCSNLSGQSERCGGGTGGRPASGVGQRDLDEGSRMVSGLSESCVGHEATDLDIQPSPTAKTPGSATFGGPSERERDRGTRLQVASVNPRSGGRREDSAAGTTSKGDDRRNNDGTCTD